MALLCLECRILGYCHKKTVKIVSDRELADVEFLKRVRATAKALDYSPSEWVEKLSNFYRDFDGAIVDDAGEEVYLDMEVLEAEHIREWFRDWVNKPIPAGVRPRLRQESKERIRVLATILRARFPFDSIQWLVANDNEKQICEV